MVGSTVTRFEIEQTPDPDRRELVAGFALLLTEQISVDDAILRRASEIQALGIPGLDSVHLACAEHAGVDVFLTTDDRLLRRATRRRSRLRVAVDNPVTWFQSIESTR
ncbi:MAG: PIN domain-containing protein [Dehalococcoidia bacterium]